MAGSCRTQNERSMWRGRPLGERLHHLLTRFVAHPLVVELVQAIRRRVKHVENGGRPAGILILAPSGGGKTRFCEYLRTLYPSKDLADRRTFPFVAIATPLPCTTLEVANAILRELGDPLCDGGRTRQQCERAKFLLREARTVILAVDNAHDIVERTGPVGIQKVGNFIRDLIDECNLVVLLLGTPGSALVVDANPQLKRRIPGRQVLSDYDITGKDGMAKFLRLEQEIEQVLPMAEASSLSKGQIGKSLAFASDGKFAHLMNLIGRGVEHAVSENREHIGLDDLFYAYEDYFLRELAVINPFKSGYSDWRRLNHPGEPYYVEDDERPVDKKDKGAPKK